MWIHIRLLFATVLHLCTAVPAPPPLEPLTNDSLPPQTWRNFKGIQKQQPFDIKLSNIASIVRVNNQTAFYPSSVGERTAKIVLYCITAERLEVDLCRYDCSVMENIRRFGDRRKRRSIPRLIPIERDKKRENLLLLLLLPTTLLEIMEAGVNLPLSTSSQSWSASLLLLQPTYIYISFLLFLVWNLLCLYPVCSMCTSVCVCGHKEQTTWNILVGYSNLITMLLSTQKRDTHKTRGKEGGNTAEKKEGGHARYSRTEGVKCIIIKVDNVTLLSFPVPSFFPSSPSRAIQSTQ